MQEDCDDGEQGGTDADYWAFSVALYGKSGVASSCILLQDTAGVDVNVLLVALYTVKVCGIDIDRERIGELDSIARDIRTEVVVPLRTIRRRMKGHDYGVPTHALRKQVKALELAAERSQQDRLALQVRQWETRGGSNTTPFDIVLSVVNYYANKDITTLLSNAEICQAAEIIGQAVEELFD